MFKPNSLLGRVSAAIDRFIDKYGQAPERLIASSDLTDELSAEVQAIAPPEVKQPIRLATGDVILGLTLDLRKALINKLAVRSLIEEAA